MNTDKVLIRSKDIGLIIGILTLAGMVWALAEKPFEWNQTTKDMEMLKPKVEEHDKQITTIGVQFTYIERELRAINRKLPRQ